jgi:Protein of unknown function (DUF1579)
MRTISRLLVLLAVCGLFCLSLAAQQKAAKPKAAKPKAQSMNMAMPMPKPSPEMMKLTKAIGGNWTVTEKHEPDPMMMPKGGTGHGTAAISPGPGGLSLVEKYHSTGAMGSFTGLGTFWWDPKASVYRGVWCDNMTPQGCDASGSTKWEGDKLVGTMEGADMAGKKMTMTFTYSDFKPNSFVMTMEMGPDSDHMKKTMSITYKKAGAASKMEGKKE